MEKEQLCREKMALQRECRLLLERLQELQHRVETPMWHSTVPRVGSHHTPGSGHVKVLEDRCQSQAVHAWRNSSSEGLWIEASDFDEDGCICAGSSWWPWHSRGLATECWQWTVQGDLCCNC